MYLSRVELDVYNRRKMRDLKDLNSYHGFVESCFPEEIDKGIRTRKLWRIDKLNKKTYLLIQSQIKPNKEILEKYGVIGTSLCKDYDKFIDSLEEGMKARFRVKLNTVISKSTGNKDERGRIVPVPTRDLADFFLARTDKNGFKVSPNDFDIFEKELLPYKKVNKKPYSLVSASYEGVLTINDLERFRQSLKNGIGRKKAYGFGMLTIIPYEK